MQGRSTITISIRDRQSYAGISSLNLSLILIIDLLRMMIANRQVNAAELVRVLLEKIFCCVLIYIYVMPACVLPNEVFNYEPTVCDYQPLIIDNLATMSIICYSDDREQVEQVSVLLELVFSPYPTVYELR